MPLGSKNAFYLIVFSISNYHYPTQFLIDFNGQIFHRYISGEGGNFSPWIKIK